MKNPIELLQFRLDEMTKESARILATEYDGKIVGEKGSFNKDKFLNLKTIDKSINEYKSCIKILEESIIIY